jgi:NDP-sugar pyrophosphorylase family protein
MKSQITRAMVLAAGLGTRLRPLTYKIPKPLLPLDSRRLIDYSLYYLARQGISDVMINLHHLGDMIRDHVGDGGRYNLKVAYSFEPEILGTGGGIKNCEEFFEGKPFVCINSDSLLNCDLAHAVERHFQSGAAATMVLKSLGPDDPYEGIGIENGFVKKIGGKGAYFYTGLQVIGPDLLHELPPKGTASCLVKDGYQKLLGKGKKVAAFLYDGYFNDLGTPERYERAKDDAAKGILKA